MRGYGIPSAQKFALGVRSEVRPFVRPSPFHFRLNTFNRFIQILYKSLYLGGVVRDHRWVNLSSKHRDIVLYVVNWSRCSVLAKYFINFPQYKDLGVL